MSFSGDQGRLKTYFQPIVKISTQEIYAHECLARWELSTGYAVTAGELVGLMQQLGALDHFNQYLWRFAMNFSGESPFISINASPRDLRKQLADIFECVESSGMPVSQLIVEIAEPPVRHSEAINLKEAIAVLNQAGAQVWMTEAGLDRKSLESAHWLGLTGVKIDGRISRDYQMHAVPAAVQILHELGMVAIAEKVESRVDLHRVANAGFDYAQGYHLGAPSPKPAPLTVSPTGDSL